MWQVNTTVSMQHIRPACFGVAAAIASCGWGRQYSHGLFTVPNGVPPPPPAPVDEQAASNVGQKKSKHGHNEAQNRREERDTRKQAEKILQWDLISDQVQLVAEGLKPRASNWCSNRHCRSKNSHASSRFRHSHAQPTSGPIYRHRVSHRSKTCEIARMQPQLRAKVWLGDNLLGVQFVFWINQFGKVVAS